MSPEEEALQKYIDSRIPRGLQEQYRQAIGWIKGGWAAAMSYVRALKGEDL